MAQWKITPVWKKSVIETQTWVKDGVAGYIENTLCWRFGEFIIESDKEPEIDEYTDLTSLTEHWSTDDCCSEEREIDIADDEEREKIEQFLEENSIYDLEELGWVLDEAPIVIENDVNIELVD